MFSGMYLNVYKQMTFLWQKILVPYESGQEGFIGSNFVIMCYTPVRDSNKKESCTCCTFIAEIYSAI